MFYTEIACSLTFTFLLLMENKLTPHSKLPKTTLICTLELWLTVKFNILSTVTMTAVKYATIRFRTTIRFSRKTTVI